METDLRCGAQRISGLTREMKREPSCSGEQQRISGEQGDACHKPTAAVKTAARSDSGAGRSRQLRKFTRVQRLIEQPADEGDVLNGDVRLGRVLYHLSVYRQFAEADDEATLTSLVVEGRITPVDRLDLPAFFRRRTELRLHLADGRWLDFLMANETGAVRSTGRGLHRS
jgi:hypothetical protein